MEIKVVLPARDIPLGETVTKVTGEKPYKLIDTVKFYGDDAPENVVAEKGVLFLVSEGQINIIPADKELAWRVDEMDLLYWLQDRGAA